MITFLRTMTALLTTLLLACNGPISETTSNRNDSATNNGRVASLVDTPRSFVKNYGATDSTRLFAFVGKKVFVEPLPRKHGSMDYGFRAKYVVLQKVYGKFQHDTIEFVAYDHYGAPLFSIYNHVLLYVSADSGTYFHQKYLYNDVYKTKDGRWAGAYEKDDYLHAYNKHTTIKPVKIDFAEKVLYPAMDIYAGPYFERVGDSVRPVYGNYVEELFTLKQTGHLTARELFEPTPQQEEDMVESMQPEPPKTAPTADDLKFLSFWTKFVASVTEADLKNFRNIALDSMMICDNLISTDKFIEKCFGEVIDEEVKKRIKDKTKLEYTSEHVEFYNLFTSMAKKEVIKFRDHYRFRQMLVTRSSRNNNPPEVEFNFIETKKGYRLYGIGHHWFKDCCK